MLLFFYHKAKIINVALKYNFNKGIILFLSLDGVRPIINQIIKNFIILLPYLTNAKDNSVVRFVADLPTT